jgi:hypothetical protein
MAKELASQSGDEGFNSSSYMPPRFLGMYKWVAFIGCYVANIA